MKTTELKKILKPLIKQCIKEVIYEEGTLSKIVSEVVQGLGAQPLVEAKKAQAPKARKKDDEREKFAKLRLEETRKKMLDAIGTSGMKGVDIFEGTAPLSSAGGPGPVKPGSPLKDYAPDDPGVNIEGIMSVAGVDWKKFI